MRSLPCSGCVALSAYLLAQHMDDAKAGNLTSHGAFMANISEIASGRENVYGPGSAQILIIYVAYFRHQLEK